VPSVEECVKYLQFLKANRNLLKRQKVHFRHFIDNIKVQFYDVHKKLVSWKHSKPCR